MGDFDVEKSLSKPDTSGLMQVPIRVIAGSG
jgi:hypothetical protein